MVFFCSAYSSRDSSTSKLILSDSLLGEQFFFFEGGGALFTMNSFFGGIFHYVCYMIKLFLFFLVIVAQ